ncbi:MAG: ion transporter [Enterococcus sp.]|nr:ion transporter [Enterococcus sp.]
MAKANKINKKSFKYHVYVALEDLPDSKGIAKVFGILLLVLIVLNALLIGVDTSKLDPFLAKFLFYFNVFSTIAFGIEYLLRLWVADFCYPKLSKAASRSKYALSIFGIIDLFSFLPIILLWFFPFSQAIVDCVRVIRLARLIKITRYMRGLKVIGDVFAKRKREIISAFAVVLLLCLASSVLMYGAEHYAQPDKFDSIYTGIYWSVTTMTNTGYGDLVPITPMGRFVGILTMILSVGVIAIPAGIFSAGFVAEFNERDQKTKQQRQARKDKVEAAKQKDSD